MKSLLEPAPYTPEDSEAWYFLRCRIQHYREGYAQARRLARYADQRDACIMLFLESAKANGCHDTLTRVGQLHGFIGSFVRLPGIPVRDEDYA